MLSSFSFTLLTTRLPTCLIYPLNMQAQLPPVMLLMLVTIGIFLYPWTRVSDKINKGPSYALGLFIARLAVIATCRRWSYSRRMPEVGSGPHRAVPRLPDARPGPDSFAARLPNAGRRRTNARELSYASGSACGWRAKAAATLVK